jgi:hypothetical protein
MEKAIQEMVGTLSKLSEYTKKIEELAVLVGAKPTGLTTHNALLSCEKAIRDYVDLKEQAEESGTSLPNALRSYKMTKRPRVELPPYLRFAPPHWIQEETTKRVQVWKDSLLRDRVYKVPAVTAATAQRLRNGLQDQLENLFLLIEEKNWSENHKEEYRREVQEAYRNLDYKMFSQTLSECLWELNTGEEVYCEEKPEKATLDCYSEGFERCEVEATVYSTSIRKSLAEWGRNNEIAFDKETLEDWSHRQPNYPFSHLARQYFKCDKPVNEWILRALTERKLASSSSLNWSDLVTLELLETLVAESAKLVSEGEATHEGIVSSLEERCLEFM